MNSTDTRPIDAPGAPTELVCWKVWGGNSRATTPIRIPGLHGVLHAAPHGGNHGGDLYYMSACGSGAIARFCLADVAGHGEAAASISSWLERTFSKQIHRENPGAVLDEVNELAVERGFQVMSTALCMSYNSLNGNLHFCNAGHPHIRVCRKGRNVWEELHPPSPNGNGLWNLPLGVTANARYALGRVKLQPGDRLLLYTDGLIEARDHSGDQIGDSLWNATPTTGPPADAVARLLDQFHTRVGSSEAPQDDLTIVMLEVQPFQKGNRLSLMFQNHIWKPLMRKLHRRPALGKA